MQPSKGIFCSSVLSVFWYPYGTIVRQCFTLIMIFYFNANAGNELVEEDVDIVGGNDPPISNYPPLEIEKDGTNRNSKGSSSSSSSSESGSSSSGSC